MSDYHLVSHNLCPFVQRVAITLAEKQLAFERTYVDLSNKPDWFQTLSPLGKTPVLQVNGKVLFESAVICDYLDEVEVPRLHPTEPFARAQHRAWVEFASATLQTIGAFYSAPDADRLEKERNALIAKFQRLESELGGHDGPYFADDRFSLVDAAFGPVFRYFDVFDTIADFHVFDETPRVAQWRATLAARPSVRDAVMPDYAQGLRDFLVRKNSALSALIGRARPTAA